MNKGALSTRVQDCAAGQLTHTTRFSIIIITNQALSGKNAIPEWKKKAPLIGAAVSVVRPDLHVVTQCYTASRCPLPPVCCHGERRVSKTDTRDVVRAGTHVRQRRGHHRCAYTHI